MTSPQKLIAEYGQNQEIPLNIPENPGTGTYTFQTCYYFTTELYNNSVTRDTVVNVTLNDTRHIALIADRLFMGQANQAASSLPTSGVNLMINNLKQKLEIKGQCSYNLRNQSNEPIRFTAYICKPRGNINYVENVNSPNIYRWLATGFANNGLDSGNFFGSTNVTMYEATYSPYDSFDFVRDIKIVGQKAFTIQPGQFKRLKLSSRGKLIRPADIVQLLGTSGVNTWGGQVPKYAMNKHEKFILFKIWSNPAGWGAAQATYAKQIQMTQPGFVMHTRFKYTCRRGVQLYTPSGLIEKFGIADNSTAQPPAFIVPDAAIKGSLQVAI